LSEHTFWLIRLDFVGLFFPRRCKLVMFTFFTLLMCSSFYCEKSSSRCREAL